MFLMLCPKSVYHYIENSAMCKIKINLDFPAMDMLLWQVFGTFDFLLKPKLLQMYITI